MIFNYLWGACRIGHLATHLLVYLVMLSGY